jgi:hypothetical protein|tara:strand:+ start:3767 stop:4681 length:915 start_codon:yes stop_codon:yes gene_type:complete
MFDLDPTAPNIIPIKYRQVAVATVACGLDEAALMAHFVGKEAYMRTRFIVVRNGTGTALVEVDRPTSEALFSDITAMRLIAAPHECVYVADAEIDVGVPAHLAAVAERHPGALCVVVEGLYSHVSFIVNPRPFRLNVLDIVPPEPSKLLDQARRVLDVGEDLPPVLLSADTVDSRELLDNEGAGARKVLLPCQATGVDFGDVNVSFLDQRPQHDDWTILGCERTRQIHEWFYSDARPSIDTCPKRFLDDQRDADGVTLSRCCLLQEGMEHHGRAVVVPWGSTLDEVRAGIQAAVAREGFRWTPV